MRATRDIAVFSFHPVKIVTTGEGGMVVTNDAELAERAAPAAHPRHHARRGRRCRAAEGPWYYQQIELGFNYRMTDMQAALGASQMRRAGRVRRAPPRAGRALRRAARGTCPCAWQTSRTTCVSAWHLFVVELRAPATAPTVFAALREAGIGVNVHYIPVHLQPYYRGLGFAPGDFPEAEAYYARAITLPLFPAMTDTDVDAVVDSIARSRLRVGVEPDDVAGRAFDIRRL